MNRRERNGWVPMAEMPHLSPWNFSAEEDDIGLLGGQEPVMLVVSRGRNKRDAGELTPRYLRRKGNMAYVPKPRRKEAE